MGWVKKALSTRNKGSPQCYLPHVTLTYKTDLTELPTVYLFQLSKNEWVTLSKRTYDIQTLKFWDLSDLCLSDPPHSSQPLLISAFVSPTPAHQNSPFYLPFSLPPCPFVSLTPYPLLPIDSESLTPTLSFLYFLSKRGPHFAQVYVCVVHTCTCLCVHAYACAHGGQNHCEVSFSATLHIVFWVRASYWIHWLAISALGINWSLVFCWTYGGTSPCLAFYTSWIWTQTLMHGQHTLYQLSYPPSFLHTFAHVICTK